MPEENEPAWRERAVARSLNAARSRAEQRVQRFLDAAFELIDEKGTTEFTIQEVVDRSKQSLRSFYEYFDGKDELVLALFEETIREADDDIRAAVDAESDPLDRLQAFAIRLHEWCDPVESPRKRGSHNRRAISEFSMHLAVNHADLRPRRLARRRTCCTSWSTPPPRPKRSRWPTAAARAHPADRDVQLVRQPPGREPEAAAHCPGDLEFLSARPRRLMRTVVVGASSGLALYRIGLACRGAHPRSSPGAATSSTARRRKRAATSRSRAT